MGVAPDPSRLASQEVDFSWRYSQYADFWAHLSTFAGKCANNSIGNPLPCYQESLHMPLTMIVRHTVRTDQRRLITEGAQHVAS